MRRILMVAYYFPPLGGIGSLRASAFASHLPDFGWDATVLAPENGAYYRDPNAAFPTDRVIRTRSLELSRAGKRVLLVGGGDTEAGKSGPVRSALRDLARQFLYFPDAQIGWYPFAAHAGRSALRRDRFDAIFSSSHPITAHLVARSLHRASGLPWVADFRDPWSAQIAGTGRRRMRAAALESALAREATAVVMTSRSWATDHGRAWGREVAVIPNGCGTYPSAVTLPTELVISYLGSFYPKRQDLSPAWSAIRRLATRGQRGRVRLRFIGELSAVLRVELREYGLEDLTEVTGFLSEANALRELASSSVLLAAGPRDADPVERGTVPAKLFDYLATGLPILWIGHTPNDGAALLSEYPGCHVVGPHSAAADIAEILVSEHGRRYDRNLAGLSRSARTGQLAKLLDGATQRG